MLKPDPEYRTCGGWKVHLTIGPTSYTERVAAVKGWLERNLDGIKGLDWKHGDGGDQHEKDFTVYLGSYATMTAFVVLLEQDPTSDQLDLFNGGNIDRIVGTSGKFGARFDLQEAKVDLRGAKLVDKWHKGWDGIPFTVEDVHRVWGGKSGQDAAQRPRVFLKTLYGSYFLPEDID